MVTFASYMPECRAMNSEDEAKCFTGSLPLSRHHARTLKMMLNILLADHHFLGIMHEHVLTSGGFAEVNRRYSCRAAQFGCQQHKCIVIYYPEVGNSSMLPSLWIFANSKVRVNSMANKEI